MAIEAQKITRENIYELVTNNKTRICEMSSDNQLINVPVNPRIDIDVITADDADPKFVNVEVIRAGISKSNRRRYNNNNVREINEMIPGCQGFFGHPDPSKYGFEFREPQCIFVGSIIEHMVDGIDRCIAKAYLFKTSQLREWIPKSIAAGNPMTVSINGTGDIMRNGDILDVVHMRELQSIDWANPGTEGMETSQAMSVVRELQNNEGGNDKMEGLNAQDIIKNATVTEFKAFNPTGYDAVVKGITVTELRQANPDLVASIESGAKITEMSLNIGGTEQKVKLDDIQGKFDAVQATITELQGKIEESKILEFKAQELARLVPEQLRDKVSCRVTGKTEDQITKSIEAEVAYIREIGGGLDNMPIRKEQKSLGSVDDVKNGMRSMFCVKKADENK